MQLIDDTLGENFPMFVVAGNHDAWRAFLSILLQHRIVNFCSKWPSYSSAISDRFAQQNVQTCNGIIGVQQTCTFGGLFFVMTAPGKRAAETFFSMC